MKLLFLATALLVQAQSFDVASIHRSAKPVGPDYNNQLVYTSDGLTARNITLARLIAEAYRLQLSQVSGPKWINTVEYDVEARSALPIQASLPTLLAERFQLKQHTENKTLKAFELTLDRPFKAPKDTAGYHFHGDMRQLADLIGVQLSIPEGHDPSRPTIGSIVPVLVIDKTALTGTYDLFLDLGPGTNWPSLVRELGLRLDIHKRPVPVIVVDSALQTPTPN